MSPAKSQPDPRLSSDHQSALEGIDRVFHEKARLSILTTIVGSPDGMSFNELKELCQLTDGNLNRHLKVLVEAKVLTVRKSGRGRSTHTHYRLTARGRQAFEKYLDALESILQAARQTESVLHRKSGGGSKSLGLES